MIDSSRRVLFIYAARMRIREFIGTIIVIDRLNNLE